MEKLDVEKKRKRNLLFFGMPRREGVSRERLISEVLRNDLGIAEGVDIKQVRRGGNCHPGEVPVPKAEGPRSVQKLDS